jgi:hypothetical protein
VSTPEERAVRNARDRARRARHGATAERFPVAPLLAYSGGRAGPIDNAELMYRTDYVVLLGPARTLLTDVEADHLAVALGRLPFDFWPEWLDYDGPHYGMIEQDWFGWAPCQCWDCLHNASHIARAV